MLLINLGTLSFLSPCWASSLSPLIRVGSFRVGAKSYLFSWWDRLDYGEFSTLVLGVQPYQEAVDNF